MYLQIDYRLYNGKINNLSKHLSELRFHSQMKDDMLFVWKMHYEDLFTSS